MIILSCFIWFDIWTPRRKSSNYYEFNSFCLSLRSIICFIASFAFRQIRDEKKFFFEWWLILSNDNNWLNSNWIFFHLIVHGKSVKCWQPNCFGTKAIQRTIQIFSRRIFGISYWLIQRKKWIKKGFINSTNEWSVFFASLNNILISLISYIITHNYTVLFKWANRNWKC